MCTSYDTTNNFAPVQMWNATTKIPLNYEDGASYYVGFLKGKTLLFHEEGREI